MPQWKKPSRKRGIFKRKKGGGPVSAIGLRGKRKFGTGGIGLDELPPDLNLPNIVAGIMKKLGRRGRYDRD